MADYSADESPSQGRSVYEEITENIGASTDAPGGSLNPTAVGFKVVRSTLRAEAPEFKPRTSSLRATATEFEPCHDLKVVKKIFVKYAYAALLLSKLSLRHLNSTNNIEFSINQGTFGRSVIEAPLGRSKEVPAIEFHLFSKLPAELRFNICLPGPRIVDLHYNVCIL
ncbi:hypothetical protein DL98DRAFT_582310 [Cadophora sp. DSE1049]|nr:hypothetical protein DL98DRAFT_582310 [Cadophora sp. DSE1049]